jgi:hypothetical protein
MAHEGTKPRGNALKNRPLETALNNKSEWLGMMAGQFREWGQDIIRDDRLTCASILDCAGHKDAAEMLRGFTFNTNEPEPAKPAV